MEMLKFSIHSMVDVITNSSTMIYTYQNSVNEAKDLVQEILNLMGITDKTPDDIFYYGSFCEPCIYVEYLLDEMDDDDLKEIEGYDIYKPLINDDDIDTDKYFEDNILMGIMKNEIPKPSWFSYAEERGDFYPDTYLYLMPKEEKFSGLAEKMKNFLGSVGADGGYDG